MRLRVKNWRDYQHYSDRCPPWIKLHFRILSSKDWVMSSDSERVLAITCMLIASQDAAGDGSFDADVDYFKRVAYLNGNIAKGFDKLVKMGFLESLEADASACKPVLANACPEERREETETETERVNETDNIVDEISEFYRDNINRSEIPSGKKNLKKLLKTEDADKLFTAVKHYHSHCQSMDTKPQFRIRMRNFFGRDSRWLDYVDATGSAKKVVDSSNPFNQNLSELFKNAQRKDQAE